MFTKVINFLKDANNVHHTHNDSVQSAEETFKNHPELPELTDRISLFNYAMYWEFEAEEADLERAAYYYLKAAQRGHVEAMYRLGKYFENPHRAVGISRVHAKIWYKRAVQKGHRGAALSYQILKLRKVRGIESTEWSHTNQPAAGSGDFAQALSYGSNEGNS